MSVQRRRGQSARIWKTKIIIDRRGNEVTIADGLGPYDIKAAFIPQRSAKAEVPGQAQINIYRMIVKPDLTDVNLWSLVEWDGGKWDFVTPPAFHRGTKRHTRHWSIDIRRRP